MPAIKSYNPDVPVLNAPTENYVLPTHGMDSRKGYISLAFQVTSPLNQRRVLLPHALVMHVNPNNFQESFNKRIERIQTRGGWVEQHWGDDLDEISAEGSTGAFVNVYSGLCSVVRQRTIAWDRFRDLHDLYRNNGSVYDPYGNIVLQGDIMLMYDRGTYLGTFRSFEFEETAETPFAFQLSWTFKVTHTIRQIPDKGSLPVIPGLAPTFQSNNAIPTRSQNGQ